MTENKINFRAIAYDDSANGFTGWIEFQADNEADAYAHAENTFGHCDFTLTNEDEEK